jgi:RNA polymerase sigma-70 factor, ECF subfamily
VIHSAPSEPRDADAVFRQYGSRVYAYVKAAGADDCEDVLGEVFVAVVRGLAKFRGDDDAFRRWIFTIAHHRVVDERRRLARGRAAMRLVADDIIAGPEDPFDPTLIAALGTLTSDQREVLILRFVADLTLEDVATMTRRPIGAVKSLQHRGLRNLAQQLGSEQNSAA